MKAKLKVLLPGFSGNMDDVVIYYNSKLNKYIVRRKVKPKFMPDNTITQKMHSFRRRIAVTDAYLDDCRRYIDLFNRHFRRQGRAMSTWPNVYMKIMRALVKEYPDVDFTTLTREEVLERDLPCKSVAAAAEAGYLEKVPGWESLDSLI
ncbi:MAG: hypothetical protein GX294_05200 [Candidatus Cloacimonetes bacterium]|nr:hypothetical protein [Candidatus Cloacimonadota bacterium]